MPTLKFIEMLCEVVVAVGVVCGGLAGLIAFTRFLTKMESQTDTILNNHLPHIYQELQGIREDFRVFLGGVQHGRNQTRDE